MRDRRYMQQRNLGQIPFIDMFLQYANKESRVVIPADINITPEQLATTSGVSTKTVVGLSVAGLAVVGLIVFLVARRSE